MNISAAGLQIQPFHSHGEPIVYVPIRSQGAAHESLQIALADHRGIGLLHGPESFGKTTVCEHFVHTIDRDIAVAVVDGTRLNTPMFLSRILAQFGYELPFVSVEEQIKMIEVFAIQQSRSGKSPVIIVDNLDRMLPVTLQAICRLAELKLNYRFALRFILVSTRPSFSIIHSPAMKPIAERLIDIVALEPLSLTDTRHYLHSKLEAANARNADAILPAESCDTLHTRSGGWPGVLDKMAAALLRDAKELPICCEKTDSPDRALLSVRNQRADDAGKPKLIITHGGDTIAIVELNQAKVLIGRSQHSDVEINEKFASHFHALLIRSDTGTSIVDLHSENGTFVNSRRVSDMQLRRLDVISLGNHRIKFFDLSCRTRAQPDENSLEDTAIFRSIDEIPFAAPGTVYPPVPAPEAV